MKMEPTKPEHEPAKAEAVEKDKASLEKAFEREETPLREDYAKRAGAEASDEPGNPKDNDHAARKG